MDRRCDRLRHLLDVSAVDAAWLTRALPVDRPVIAVVSSRVGNRVVDQRRLSRQLAASAKMARQSSAVWIVGCGTAVHPWAMHAAQTLGVPVIEVAKHDLTNNSIDAIDLDAWVVAAADRVDGLRVRRGGKIHNLLMSRATSDPASVFVAIDPHADPRHRVHDLLAVGAIGRFLSELSEEMNADPASSATPNATATTAGPRDAANGGDFADHLIHCTRAVSGPWPGQSWRSYRDDLLLGSPTVIARDCIDALCRIVKTGRLIGGHLASGGDEPVVCFSAAALPDLLSRRSYRSHLQRWDYEPFGVAISIDAAKQIGIAPVTYVDDPRSGSPIPRHRRVARGKTHDWTGEQEWRALGDVDLFALPTDAVGVFVPDAISRDRIESVNRNGWDVQILAAKSL